MKTAILAAGILTSLSFSAFAGTKMVTHDNFDSPGDVYNSFYAGSVDNCMRSCQEDSRCNSAVFDKPSTKCFLKSWQSTLNADPTGVVGLKEVDWMDGIDFPGGDYHHINNTDVDYCARICYIEARCKAFTFDKPSGTCWLKDRIASFNPDPTGLSGSK